MKVTGLFAGIGGIEIGLHNCGISTLKLCELMPEASCVLRNHFPKANHVLDVKNLRSIGKVDLLVGGFPCQDISIAGPKVGLEGTKSSLVNEIFRLLRACNDRKPEYVIIENVSNIITLHNGEALNLIVNEMNNLGYNWAYRLVDPRSFGIPQRRPRFIFVASLSSHPKDFLFPEEEDIYSRIDDKLEGNDIDCDSYGFYWTEGKIGIGWAKDSIPPLKCGSSLGLPSSPAIWDIHNNFFGTPTIQDAERLQGFPAGWTQPVEEAGFKPSCRWKLVGNAVNTRVSEWIGHQIVNHPVYYIDPVRIRISNCKPWPKAAFSHNNAVFEVRASVYPLGINYIPILEFLEEPLVPLSLKATLGFRKRVLESVLINYPQRFIDSLNIYLQNQYQYND